MNNPERKYHVLDLRMMLQILEKGSMNTCEGRSLDIASYGVDLALWP